MMGDPGKQAFPPLIRQLLDPVAYPHEVRDLQVVETHISWVVLTGEFAYKIKKPVSLGFLDFSTLANRRHFCEEELRVNRRTAPRLYLGVVPIGRVADGMRIGVEPAVEYAVQMRQFRHVDRLDRRLLDGRLGAGDMRPLAETIAAFHMGLAARKSAAADFEIERATKPARNNFVHLDPKAFDDPVQQRLAVIESWTREQAAGLAGEFAARARAGAVRECHGDLHLENLLFRNGKYLPFDAIEFNPELRWIDVASDAAFLAMDLAARERQDLAYLFLNAWLEATGDYGSLSVLRYYLVYRSMVRAVVAAIRRQQGGERGEDSARPGAERYVELAAGLVDTPPPRLYLMHGFSGSGKTWHSERLVARLPALRVRSDLERKRAANAAPGGEVSREIGEGLYGEASIDQTYRVLLKICECGLRAGFDMIADATFLQSRHREWFLALARSLGVQPIIVECAEDGQTLRARLRQRQKRGRDASDAGLDVLKYQQAHHDALRDEERVLARPVRELEFVAQCGTIDPGHGINCQSQ